MLRTAFRFSCPLYPIIDPGEVSIERAVTLTRAVLAARVPLLQLRVKDAPTALLVEIARAVKALTDQANALLIINDRPDVAALVDAAGVHLGQGDLPPRAARGVLGLGKIIGFSTHSLEQLTLAHADPAIDYVAFGPVFATTSKLKTDPVQGIEGLRRIRPHCRLPLVAIGGITRETAPLVLAAGADAVAIIGAICRASDPLTATRDLLSALGDPRAAIKAPRSLRRS